LLQQLATKQREVAHALVLPELVKRDDLGIAPHGFFLDLDLDVWSSSSSSSSSCVSKRRPNSTEGSTKVRSASKGITIGSGLLPKFSVMLKAFVGHRQVFEPVLDHNRHFRRIAFTQPVGECTPGWWCRR
jgi:hypothetical protein